MEFLSVTDPLAADTAFRPVIVVLNWFQELRARAPAP
jgi:hypothetical protein